MKRTFSVALSLTAVLACSPQLAATQPPSTRDIQQYLERQQEMSYKNLGWTMPTYSQADLDAQIRRLQEENLVESIGQPETTAEYDARVMEEVLGRVQTMRAKGLLQLPTRYEDPRMYLELAILVYQIETGNQRVFGKDLVPRPVFGTLPTGEVNASVKRQSGGYLVAFDSGLFKFADHLSGILALSLPLEGRERTWFRFTTDREAIERHLNANPVIIAHLQTIIRAYVMGGAPALAAAPDAPRLVDPFGRIARILYRDMLLFVLGHEYGHIIALHYGLPSGTTFPTQWGREIAADGWGILFSMTASDGGVRSAAASIWGMKVFLACYELIDRSVATLATGTETSRQQDESHPPTEVRLHYLPDHFRMLAKRLSAGSIPPTPEELENTIRESKSLDAITELLWERLKPGLVALHNQGMRPDAVWHSK